VCTLARGVTSVSAPGDRTRDVRAAVFSNLDGLVAFHTSAEDAEYLAEELGGGLDKHDLLELGHYQAYARLTDVRWREGLPTFSVRLEAPPRGRCKYCGTAGARFGAALRAGGADVPPGALVRSPYPSGDAKGPSSEGCALRRVGMLSRFRPSPVLAACVSPPAQGRAASLHDRPGGTALRDGLRSARSAGHRACGNVVAVR
jgi:hypothetical protein